MNHFKKLSLKEDRSYSGSFVHVSYIGCLASLFKPSRNSKWHSWFIYLIGTVPTNFRLQHLPEVKNMLRLN